MPPPTHSRRHRSASSRRKFRLGRAFTGPFLLIAAFFLGVLSTRTQEWNALATGAAVLSVLVALLALACLAGRFAAGVRNFFSVHSAHNDLGNFMRTDKEFRAARDGISRPAH